jgi:hypothetical protein
VKAPGVLLSKILPLKGEAADRPVGETPQ